MSKIMFEGKPPSLNASGAIFVGWLVVLATLVFWFEDSLRRQQ